MIGDVLRIVATYLVMLILTFLAFGLVMDVAHHSERGTRRLPAGERAKIEAEGRSR